MRFKKIVIITLIVIIGVVIISRFYSGQNKKTAVENVAIEKIDYSLSANATDDPFLGNETAKVVLVEFADFECPYCQQEFSTLRELANLYPQIKIVFRDLPLISIHKNALPAAIAANCAHKQNKFWFFHDQLFLNQGQLSNDLYTKIATRAGLDLATFNQCLGQSLIKDEIVKDVEDATKMSVEGTPTFFLNGKKISGIISLEVWQKIINAALLNNK